MRRARFVRWAAGVTVGLGAAGCQIGSHTTVHEPTTTRTIFHSNTPRPTKTVVRNYQTLDAGQAGELVSRAQHAGLDILVRRPTVSHTRLSTTHGYGPQNGSYVTFKLTIRNIGKVPILVQRLDFFVQTPGAGKTTTDDGNSPASGSDSQLDSTQLTPGEHLTNYLTFDVARPTGTFFYAPNGDKSLAWRF